MIAKAMERAGGPPDAPAGSAASAGMGLEVAGVNKTYQTRRREVEALKDINLEIGPGEFISLVGRSGCGKTTLLRILSGLLSPTAGSVSAGGHSVWKGGRRDDEALARFGLVFQDANLFPWYTVTDNIALPLKLRGTAKRSRRARALSCDPTVLLMDEPFGALDALTRDRMKRDLQELHAAAGATVVFVTHSISEAVFLADRVVLLTPRPGRIRSVTPVTLARPRSLETETSEQFQLIVRGLRH